jgi:hypothetical protein
LLLYPFKPKIIFEQTKACMKKNYLRHFLFITIFFTAVSGKNLFANNATYEQRRQNYIDTCLAKPNGAKLVLQAYRSLPVDTPTLTTILGNISTGVTSDFDIIELVRISYLYNGAYDAQILPVLNSVPYWINYGDTVRNYWSENHMIMWMSSDWLLHERYGKPIDATLHARLQHYLELKINYGYYEFFSSVYNPYALSGILNLADFAQDATIKSLATQAAQRLMKMLLMLTNDKGVYYPVAGRNYPGKYDGPYDQNHNNLIYLLTGMGDVPTSASHGGAFLATSPIEVDTVAATWTALMDTTFYNGHTLDSGFVLNSSMSSVDKVVFQWSSGGYFHPEVVSETVQLLIDSNLWGHVDFALLHPLASIVTPQSAPGLATELSCISESSVISGENISVFKHNSITLASVLDFWKGKVGFQQYPCVANAGTTPVYTASGKVDANWDNRNPNNQNTHLPYVMQKKNVALEMYRPEPTPQLLGNAFTFKDVQLRWKYSDFDEVVTDSLWIIGRQADGYVAVRKGCPGAFESVIYCPNLGGQAWVIMVGDSLLYGSFANFQNVIHQSQFTEKWYYDTTAQQEVYYAKIVMDTTTIEYAWGVDSAQNTGIANNTLQAVGCQVFPNPANTYLHVELTGISGSRLLQLYNMNGEMVYSYTGTENNRDIPTAALPQGIYALRCTTANGSLSKRIVIAH